MMKSEHNEIKAVCKQKMAEAHAQALVYAHTHDQTRLVNISFLAQECKSKNYMITRNYKQKIYQWKIRNN